MRVLSTWRPATVMALAVVMLFTSLQPVSAATTAPTNFNLTVSPLPVNLVTKPGQAVSTPIRIQNTGSEPVRLKVSVMKFSARGATGEPRIEEPSANDNFVKWASFSKSDFTAEPNVFNTITMTIKPPKNAAFGYYYAVIFSRVGNNAPAAPSQNKINGAVASLVLLDVQAPGTKRELSVVSFKSKKKLYQYVPATFEITTRNKGNIHVVPTGNVFISRAGGKDFIGTVSVNEEQGNVLPDSNRVFTAEWTDGFPGYVTKRQNGQVVSDSSGKPIKELSWNLANINKLRVGQYTASLTLVYNDGKQDVPINGEVSFWVIPWIPFLIILVLLSLIGVGLFVLIRTLVQRLRRLRKSAT